MKKVPLHILLTKAGYIFLLAWVLPQFAVGQVLDKRDENAIQRQAKFLVEEYQKLLVNLSNENNSIADVEKIIFNNIYGDRIFWSERVNIEDDLDPRFTEYNFPEDKSIEVYLKDFDIYYKKRSIGTIVFDNLRVSDVQRSVEGYWFVKVLFRSRFFNTHKDIPIPYPTRLRVAEVRAERADVGWTSYIMSMSYYNETADRDEYREFDFLPEVIQAKFQQLRNDSYQWIAKGEYQKARELLENAYSLKPNEEVAASLRSIKEQLSGIETREQYFSVDAYSDFIKANPQNADPYLGRGRKYLEGDQYQSAAKDFAKAIRIKPNYLKAHLFRGEAYLQMGKEDSALISLEKALDISSQDIALSLKIARLYYSLGRYPESRTILDEAVSQFPEIPQLYKLRSRVNFAVRQLAATTEDLQVLAYLEKDSLQNVMAIGRTYELMGQTDKADSCFFFIREKEPSFFTNELRVSTSLLKRAEKLYKEGAYTRAIHLVNERILISGIEPVDLLLRGKACFDAGMPTFALEDFTSLLLAEESAEAYYLRALAAQRLGNVVGAKTDLSEAIERDPYLCDAYLLLAKTYEDENDYGQAVSHYKQALKCKPNQPQYHLELAKLHFRNEAYDQAESSAEDALIFDPQQAEAYLIIGRSQIQLDRYREAERQYLKFLKFGIDDPEVYLELAEFYEKYYGLEKRAEKFRKKANRS